MKNTKTTYKPTKEEYEKALKENRFHQKNIESYTEELNKYIDKICFLKRSIDINKEKIEKNIEIEKHEDKEYKRLSIENEVYQNTVDFDTKELNSCIDKIRSIRLHILVSKEIIESNKREILDVLRKKSKGKMEEK